MAPFHIALGGIGAPRCVTAEAWDSNRPEGHSLAAAPGLTRCGRRFSNSFVLGARAFALATFAILLLAACSTGETQVQGDGTFPTGPTETGPTATGPTATDPTASGEFDGPVSVDLLEAGAWTAISRPYRRPVRRA